MSCQRGCLRAKLVVALVLGIGVAGAAMSVHAQHNAYPNAPTSTGPNLPKAISKIPPAISPEYNQPDLVQPLIDPLTFNSDFQFFAPPDLSTYGGAPPPNVGWYFAYDREYISINKPEATRGVGDTFARPFDGRWLWGNRYDFGYMTRENHGWNVTYSKVTTGLLIDDPELFIRLAPTYQSIEVSKTFRKRLRNGGELEPYFGLRYMYFADNTTDRSPTFILLDDAGDPILDENGIALTETEDFNQKMQNQLLGGQLGCRYHIRKGRWNMQSDFKLMASQNYQYASVRDIDTALGVNEVNMSFSEFCPVGEFRGEVAYEVTRDISLRVGFGVMHVARGILRADMAPAELNPNNPNINFTPNLVLTNDQSLTLAGVMFGIEYNR